MKRIIGTLISVIMIFTFFSCLQISASNEITVIVDGIELKFDAQPFIEEGRTLVPFRKIAEAIGMSVQWFDDTKTVVAINADICIILQIDNDKAFVNGEEVKLDVPARIKDSRTFIPLRFICEETGADVSWNEKTRTITVKTK